MISFKDFSHLRVVILQVVRWYLAYNLSYRDIEELMIERGITLITARLTAGCFTSHQS